MDPFLNFEMRWELKDNAEAATINAWLHCFMIAYVILRRALLALVLALVSATAVRVEVMLLN